MYKYTKITYVNYIVVEETNMELSDPRSYEHYLSGSENRA